MMEKLMQKAILSQGKSFLNKLEELNPDKETKFFNTLYSMAKIQKYTFILAIAVVLMQIALFAFILS